MMYQNVFSLSSRFYFFGILLFSFHVFAVPTTLTFQTKIYRPDNTLLDATNVNFRFTTVDPTGTCILYVEDFSNLDMSASTGLAVFNLGSGTKVFPVAAFTFTNLFNNLQASFTCQGGGTYSPSIGGTDNRKIIAQFNDGTSAGWQTLPAVDVNSVPFANYAGDSRKFAGYAASDFLRFAALPVCIGSDVLTFNGTSILCAPVGGGGSADATTVTKGIIQVGTGLNVAAGLVSVAYGTTASTAAAGNDGRFTDSRAPSGGAGGDLTGTYPNPTLATTTVAAAGYGSATSVPTFTVDSKGRLTAAANLAIALPQSQVTNLTTDLAAKLPLAGGTMTGTLVNNTNSISTALAVTQAGAGYAATFLGGGVGIGTTTPNRNLSVFDATFPTIQVVNSTTGSNAGDGSYFQQNGLDGLLVNQESANLIFGTNSAERVRIDTNGSVGIGTNAPSTFLEIEKSQNSTTALRIENPNVGTSAGVQLELAIGGTAGGSLGVSNPLSASFGVIAASDTYLFTTDDLAFAAGTSGVIKFGIGAIPDEKMRIQANGNVGIGITNPGTSLDVNGAANLRGLAAPAVSPAGQGRIYFDSTANKFKVSENSGAYSDLVANRASWSQSSAFSTTNSSGNGVDITAATASLSVNDGDLVKVLISCQIRGEGLNYGQVTVEQVGALTAEGGGMLWDSESGSSSLSNALNGERNRVNNSTTYHSASWDYLITVRQTGTLQYKLLLRSATGVAVWANNCKIRMTLQ